jgi:hypothetical protein
MSGKRLRDIAREWKGSLPLRLITIGVHVRNADESKSVISFRQLHKSTGRTTSQRAGSRARNTLAGRHQCVLCARVSGPKMRRRNTAPITGAADRAPCARKGGETHG